MGDRHYLQLTCAGCGTKNPSDEDYNNDPLKNACYYAPSSGFMDFKCRNCGKRNWIYDTYGTRIVDEKELEELYKENGFS